MNEFLLDYLSTTERSSRGKWYIGLDEDDKIVPCQFSIHNNIQVCQTIDKVNESSKKSFDSMDKSHDDTAKLEKTIAYLAKMMKDEGNGDNDIWMNNKD